MRKAAILGLACVHVPLSVAAQTASVPGVLVMTSSYSADVVRARDAGKVQIDYVADNFVHAVDWIEQQIMNRGNRIRQNR